MSPLVSVAVVADVTRTMTRNETMNRDHPRGTGPIENFLQTWQEKQELFTFTRGLSVH